MSEIVVQGTEAWMRLRCGKVTASRVSDVMARIKSGWGASRANYAAELIAERLTRRHLPRPSGGRLMVIYCHTCDRQWDSDFHEVCPGCEREDDTPFVPRQAMAPASHDTLFEAVR